MPWQTLKEPECFAHGPLSLIRAITKLQECLISFIKDWSSSLDQTDSTLCSDYGNSPKEKRKKNLGPDSAVSSVFCLRSRPLKCVDKDCIVSCQVVKLVCCRLDHGSPVV